MEESLREASLKKLQIVCFHLPDILEEVKLQETVKRSVAARGSEWGERDE